MADLKATGPLNQRITSLPPNRRYICTYDKNGKSVVHSSPPQLYHVHAGASGAAWSFSTSTVPAILKDNFNLEQCLGEEGPTSYYRSEIVVPTLKGSKLAVINLVPGGQSLMHRTVSINYSICVIRHVRIELDSGQFIELHPGDHVIQRGTMHRWYNRSSTDPARFVAVTLSCKLFEMPGTDKVLTKQHLAGTGSKQEDMKAQ